jgi:hypothetical protein
MPELGPMLAKAAAATAWDNVKFHLPRVRLDDTLLGAAGGAALGAGVYGARRAFGGNDPEERKPSLLGHALAGAAAGAVGGNVIGDRARRYVVNNTRPYGYTAGQAHLAPKSLGHLWRTAVLDQPDLEALTDAPNVEKFEAGEWNGPLKMRHDIFRLSAGLPQRFGTFNPLGDTDFRPNDHSGGVPGRFPAFEFSPTAAEDWLKGTVGTMLRRTRSRRAKEPAEIAEDMTFGELLSRHGVERTGPDRFRMFDLWDFEPSDQEKALLGRLLSAPGRWQAEVSPEDAAQVDLMPDVGKTNLDLIKSLGSRLLANRFLLHRGGALFDQEVDVSDPNALTLLYRNAAGG